MIALRGEYNIADDAQRRVICPAIRVDDRPVTTILASAVTTLNKILPPPPIDGCRDHLGICRDSIPSHGGRGKRHEHEVHYSRIVVAGSITCHRCLVSVGTERKKVGPNLLSEMQY